VSGDTTRPLRASVAREWARLRADPWDMAMLTAIPLVLYLLTWWILSAGVARDLPLVVYDLDNSAMSRSLVRMLDQSPGLKVVRAASGESEAMALIRERNAFGVVSIPAGLQQDVSLGRGVKLQWAYNAQYPSYTGTMTRDVRTVVSTLAAGIELQGRAKRGMGAVQARAQFEPIRTRVATLFNENGSYEPALALPVILSLLHIFVTLGAVTAIGRELRAASVPAWLAAANGKLAVAVLGKLAIPFASFVLQAMLVAILFGVLRGWPASGSGVAIVAATLLLITSYLAMGLMLVALTPSLRVALSACAFLTAPAFAFTGQGFPTMAMPLAARVWAESLPLTHFIPVLNNAWLAGAPLRYSLGQIGVLLLFTLGFGLIGYVRLAKRVQQPDTWGQT
jgi:ABC-2 type transport system permease protein